MAKATRCAKGVQQHIDIIVYSYKPKPKYIRDQCYSTSGISLTLQ